MKNLHIGQCVLVKAVIAAIGLSVVPAGSYASINVGSTVHRHMNKSQSTSVIEFCRKNPRTCLRIYQNRSRIQSSVGEALSAMARKQ